MKKLLLQVIIVLVFSCVFSGIVCAQDLKDGDISEGYATPTFRELYTTIAMFGGIDINDKDIINEYARMTDCEEYTKFFKNDYEWKIRYDVLAKRLKNKEEPYRVLYEIVDVIKLGRYDFDEGFFPLEGSGAVSNIGNVQLFDSRMFQDYCGSKEKVRIFPPRVNVLLANPLSINKIKIKKDYMKEMSDLIAKYNLTDTRRLYQRVRIKITDAVGYGYSNGNIFSSELEGKVMGVDFFFDRELTKKVPYVEGYN